MSVAQDELMYLQSQLEGLESIFFELIPCGVELKRQQVQDYYDKRFEFATKPYAPVAENELRRQFNTKANQVRNLVDSAESLGDAANKVNLVRAAATLPTERSVLPKESVMQFVKSLFLEKKVDPKMFSEIIENPELTALEGRLLLACLIFIVEEFVDYGGKPMELRDLLSQILGLVRACNLLPRNDPFLVEAQCALEAMENE